MFMYHVFWKKIKKNKKATSKSGKRVNKMYVTTYPIGREHNHRRKIIISSDF